VLRSILTILAAIFISQIAAPRALAERKIAFVVGIDKYDHLGQQQQLQRAVNDARSVGGALAALGFEVVRAENVARGASNAEWQKFLDKIAPGDMAAVYFSGHGVEIEGLNFLLPRDLPNISYGRQEQLKRESLSANELLLDLRRRKPQVTLFILDACRDHPLIPPEQRSLNWGAGLARMDAPTGTFIMYSAGAGETALDRLPGDDPDKVNSIYTRKLLPLLKTPGLPLHELARQLRVEVYDLAAAVPHVQQPAYYDGLIGKFCLAGCDAVASVPKVSRQKLPITSTDNNDVTTRPQVSPQSEYAGLRIEMSQEEILYIKGDPRLVFTKPNEKGYQEDVDLDKIEKGKSVRDYPTWVYDVGKGQANLTVDFDDKNARHLQCTSLVALNDAKGDITVKSAATSKWCPDIAGIADGSSEQELLRKHIEECTRHAGQRLGAFSAARRCVAG
jgi:hypothetical protein